MRWSLGPRHELERTPLAAIHIATNRAIGRLVRFQVHGRRKKETRKVPATCRFACCWVHHAEPPVFF
ncbi:MAG: hypothetical protein CMJ81_15920 [Planctomycetaceae bacterium]|nr:hypothetical protein [Planctomycetaceae bacterium]MBP62311.1 hypothetical protein [Planctomycetaceae bacterium]